MTPDLCRMVMEKDLCTYCRKPFNTEAKMVLNDMKINCHASCFKVENNTRPRVHTKNMLRPQPCILRLTDPKKRNSLLPMGVRHTGVSVWLMCLLLTCRSNMCTYKQMYICNRGSPYKCSIQESLVSQSVTFRRVHRPLKNKSRL